MTRLLRFAAIFIITLCTLCVNAEDDIIKDRTLVYDHLTETYLCSVPESMFDDGTVSAYHTDAKNIRFTFLPIVRLHGTFGYDYAEGTVDVIMPDGNDSQMDMSMKAKWRGGMTNADGINKRNYHLKFLNEKGKKQDRKFFGLRNDNSWLMDACNCDRSRIRNRAAMDLWNLFARKPYWHEQEPKALTNTRGQFVEVFLNDEYVGIYCMSENIDRSQLKLKKYEDAEPVVIHGQLWKTKDFNHTGFFSYSDYDNTSDMWGGYETKYPDIDDVNPTDYSVMHDAVKFVVDSSDEEYRARYDEYFDFDSFVDYFVFMHTLWARDNMSGKNCFWACYDKQVSKKLAIIPWDIDCSVGQAPSFTDPHNEMVHPEVDDTMFYSNVFYRTFATGVHDFWGAVKQRYTDVRAELFSTDNLIRHYHSYSDMLTKSGAYRRETERWDKDSDIGGDTLDFEAEIAYMDDWLKRHLDFLDNKTFCISGINEIKIPAASQNTIYDLGGRRIQSNQQLRKGIYISNGKKILIL